MRKPKGHPVKLVIDERIYQRMFQICEADGHRSVTSLARRIVEDWVRERSPNVGEGTEK